VDFLIKDGGTVVGTATIDQRYSWSWELDGLHVHSLYQSQGFGTILLTTACAYADRHQKDLELIVASGGPMSNDQLEAWYARFGFQKATIGMRRVHKRKENMNVD
jgi:ribosomal protein S18 acetylase RimI-like enzyme